MKTLAFLRKFSVLAAAICVFTGTAFAANSVVTASLSGGATQMAGAGSLQFVLASQGTENGVGFSATFDPTVLRYDGFSNGSGFSNATINVNATQSTSGKVGVALALPGGSFFAAGNKQLVVMNFTVLSAAGTGTSIGFGDIPIAQEISDVLAEVVASTFTGVTFNAIPVLSTAQSAASKSLTAGSAALSFVPVSAVGGTSPYAYEITPALPSALSLNTATGAITGTPATNAGPVTYTVKITDATTATASNTFSLTVNPALATTVDVGGKALTINTSAVAFKPVISSAGTSPYTYAITGAAALPSGLSINATTGVISGTPTVTSASTTYTVTATDAASATSTKTFTLVVNPALVATPAVATRTLTAGNGAAPSFVPVTGSGGTTVYAYSINPDLPTALVFNSTTGSVSGTPNAAAAARLYTVTVTDAAGATATNTFTLTINGVIAAAQTVATKGLTLGTAAAAFTPVTVSGGTSSFTYTVAPALPVGLVLASGTGVITGTPTAVAAAANYTVTVTDANGAKATNSFGLTVNAALTSTAAVATKGLTLNSVVTAFTPVTKAGGTSPFAFAVSPALPAGLTLSTADGSVYGTPTLIAAAADYTVTITDGASATTSKVFNLKVNPALVATQVIATREVTAGAAITAFTPVTATGGSAPLVFSVSPELPSGLSIATGSGEISGNPTAAAALAPYKVTVTDAAGATANASFTLKVNGPLSANATIHAARTLTVGGLAPAFAPVLGGGGTGAYTYAISSALPAGLTFNLASGEISGSPTSAAAAANFTITVTDSTTATASRAFSLTINAALSTTKPFPTRAITAGSEAISFIPVAGAAGTAPYAYSVSPSLPANLNINSQTGAITGTATTAASSATYTVTVGDSAFATATNTFVLTVNVALAPSTTLALRTLTAGTAFSFTPLSLTGGTPSYVWTVDPDLPANLTIASNTGAITGTPAAARGSVNFTVTGTDAAGAKVTQVFALTINAAITTTQAVATVGPLSAGTAINGSVTPVTAAGGTLPCTFGVSPALPTGLSLNTATGAISGTPTAASAARVYTVTATDAVSAVSSKTFSLTVNGPLTANVAISAKALTAGTAATAFIPVTAGGGTMPHAFAISPQLPSTLDFNSATGEITGTPGAARTLASYKVTITDAASGSVDASFNLVINPAITTTLAVASRALSVGTTAMAFTPVTADAGTPDYTFSVAPALPVGLVLSPFTGQISGKPTAAATTANYTITITDTVGATSSKILSLKVNSALVAGAGTIATKTLTAMTEAVAFKPLPLAGGTTPYAFTVTPLLPGDLALDPTEGVITGTAYAAKESAVYTITGKDAAGAQVTQELTLTVNPALVATQSIPSKVLLNNVVATAFTPVTIMGGTSAFGYTIAPALPAGLSFAAATGAISGTPTVTLATTTFTVTVTDAVGATANKSFTLGVNTAPVITAQPVNANVNLNGNATFSVVATGFPTPTFQWKKGGTVITGNSSATTATLALTNAQLSDEAGYTVVVTNASGAVTSAPAATLTVFVLPAITTQPAAQTILAGQNATFSVAATGKPAPTYQWRRNGNLISGATADTLTLPNVSLTGGAEFTVYVTNASGTFGGSVTSAPAAVLTVNPIAPVILSTPPLAATAVKGRNFLFGPITINNTPATFSATGLPAGLTVNSTLGTISGIPAATTSGGSPAIIVLTAYNVTGSDVRTISLTVGAPPPVITSFASATGRVGTSFSFQIVATNDPTSYAATGLPTGLTIDLAGKISGTPAAGTANTYTVNLTATNASGSVSQPLVLVIDPPLNAPVYTGPANLSGTQGSAFSFTPAFGTGNTAYALAFVNPTTALPTGLSFTAATGVISGTPTQVGSFAVTLSATNVGGTTTVPLKIVINSAATAPVITSSSIAPGARVGIGFSFQLNSTGTPTASAYSATGLPAGLTLTSGTGAISGTPTVFGTFPVTVSAANTVGTGPTSILTISVAPSLLAPGITSSPVSYGQVGQTFTLFKLTASPAATSFAVTNDTLLPAGLSLNTATGEITGTPLATAVGKTTVWFRGTKVSDGTSITGLASSVLFTIAPAAATPIVNSNGTATAQVGQPFQYVITANNGPFLPPFTATGRPAWLSLDAANGILSGIPSEATTTALSIALAATNAGGTGSPKTLLLSVAPAPATPIITSTLTATGRVGTAFAYQITASETPTSFVASGLPEGLALNATGAISGSPTISKTYVVALKGANVGGLGAPSLLVIDIAPALTAPAITSAAAATGQIGAAFTYQIVATNPPILSYAVTGTLPSGLELNTATGALSGTPSADPRPYLVQLTATNAGGTSLPQSLAINVAPALGVPFVTTPLYVDATVGVDFAFTITATNLTGPAPYAPPILLDAIGLPSGLAVNPATGVILGKPTASGITVASLVATNAAGTGPMRELKIRVLPALAAPVVGGASVALGQVNVPFTYQIVASNTPTSYGVVAAPAWLSLDTATGAMTGIPTAPGPVSVQITATNAADTSSPATLDLFISPAANTPVITSTRTATGTIGVAFSYTPVATPAVPATTSYVASGLPGGLGLNSATGVIGGTPNISGTFKVILTPANANGIGAPVTIVITILPNVTFGGG